MKKYLVLKVKVDQDRNVTSILDVLFETYNYQQAEKFCRLLMSMQKYIYPLQEDECFAVGVEVLHKEICLN